MKLVQTCTFILLMATCTTTAVKEKLAVNSIPTCPEVCRCYTTEEGQHKALCYNITDLSRYSLKNKHHNINILDISFSSTTSIDGCLEEFTEIVSLDASNNKISSVNNILKKSKKLVNLNLSNNIFKSLNALNIPASVSSLNLKNNFLKDVPSNLNHLYNLKHLELEGNPISCTCNNIKILKSLHNRDVLLDNVLCASPFKLNAKKWSDVNTNEVCKKILLENSDEMMLGDQPQIFKDDENKHLASKNELDVGDTWEGTMPDDNSEDDHEYFKVSTEKPTILINNDESVEGSGDADVEVIHAKNSEQLLSNLISSTPKNNHDIEGSGDDGSGKIHQVLILPSTAEPVDENDEDYEGSGDLLDNFSTSTEPFITKFHPFLFDSFDDVNATLEPIELPKMPNIFQGKTNWDSATEKKKEIAVVETGIHEISEKPDDDLLGIKEDNIKDVATNAIGSEEASKPIPKATIGTYICIALIIALLVGVICITIVKSHLRKKRDKRLIRQQRTDVEKGGKEMVDMNKALLGKPAITGNDIEKKMNGNYEMVPTHDAIKKGENGINDKRHSVADAPLKQNDSTKLPTENGNGKITEPDSKMSHSPKHESNQPVIKITPLKSENQVPEINSNGYQDPDVNPYPQDYLPIVPPADSGRVKIVLTETPKPKTPVLVTRSRSNAGDIIVTPVADQSPLHKAST